MQRNRYRARENERETDPPRVVEGQGDEDGEG